MSESTSCPQCGTRLPENSPRGLCPACLLKQGMQSSTLGGEAPHKSWTAPQPAELASRFPQLEILELLGQGGMGAVYKVRQRELDRWAALKVLPDEVAHDPNFAERFQREAKTLAQLSHQHIVTVYEFGQRDGVYFLLMEFVNGVTLRQASRAGQVTAKDALTIVTQLCDALQFAHDEGVVHRDIKPENILIDKRGRVKIADFGLAKLLGKPANVPTLTGTNQVMGTPVYMAPEQMEGTRGVDHRADIFSLGVVFYELLTGELPLGRFAPPSQKVQVDVRLDEVVLRTLEKEPDRRYQQASEVKTDVETIRNQPLVGSSRPAAPPTRRGEWSLAKVIVTTLAVILSMVLLPVLAYMAVWKLSYRAPPVFPLTLKPHDHAKVDGSRGFEQTGSQLPPEIIVPDGAGPIIQWTADGPRLNPRFASLTPTEITQVEGVLKSIHQRYLAEEERHSVRSIGEKGEQITDIKGFHKEVAALEHDLWTQLDDLVSVEQQKQLREFLPLYTGQQVSTWTAIVGGSGGGGMSPGGGMGAMGMSALGMGMPQLSWRFPGLLGWSPNCPLPAFQVKIWRSGRWFHWELYHRDNHSENPIEDKGPELPIELRRFWRDPNSSNAMANLTQAFADDDPPANELSLRLIELDKLRAANLTPWDEVEKQATELLAKFNKPAEKGRIYWQAAQVYGQSDISGHAADVIRHAKEALRYERDPIQRGWLFMHLGCACEVRDSDPKNFVERRAEATRWFLKGYAELLPFNLPDKAPELPAVDKIGRALGDSGSGEVDPERIATEVRHAAQMKVRKEAEFTRELVHRRAVYIGRLQELFGRLHELWAKEGSPRDQLRELAVETLRDEAVVETLLGQVWPPRASEAQNQSQ